jgi:Undecaprenyl-phosphate galactose phosphotransferase WbaP
MDTDHTAVEGGDLEAMTPPSATFVPRRDLQDARFPSLPSIHSHGAGFERPERARPRPLGVEIRRQLLNAAPLAITDMVVAMVVLFTSAQLHGLVATPAGHGVRFAVALPALLVSLGLAGAYPGIGIGPVVELRSLWIGTTGLMTALVAAFAGQSPPNFSAIGFALLAWVLLLVLLPLGRAGIRSLLALTRWWGEPILVLGAGPAGRRVYEALMKQSCRGIRPLGIVDTADEMWRESDPQHASIGGNDLRIGLAEELPALAERLHVYWAVIAHSDDPQHPTRDDWLSYTAGLPHVLMESGDTTISAWTETREWGGCQALYRPDHLAMGWTRCIKRSIDIVLVLTSAFLVVPLIVLLGVLLKICSPDGPVFYGQRRIGRHGKPFTAWKFRTMVPNAESLLSDSLASNPALFEEWAEGQKLRNDPRVIPGIGTFLRKSSLDELPQVWNVLCGEMSLVGPRPLPLTEFSAYGAKNIYGHYALVRPGITGVWQVSGRNDLEYEAKSVLDEYYVRNWSLWLDIYVLGRTVRTVLLREGAY